MRSGDVRSGRRIGRARRSPSQRLLPGSGPLARVPAVVAFAVVALVFAGGVLLGGVGGALLLALLGLGVVALLVATWSRLAPGERLVRVLVLGVLLAVAVGLLVR